MNKFPGQENAKADVDSGVYEMYYKMQPGDIVVDLGANLGFFTELASDKVMPRGRVYAFEPCTDNYLELVGRVGWRHNVFTEHAAARFNDGDCNLFINDLNCGAHSVFQEPVHKRSEVCRGISIGQYLKKNLITPNFIKIDTEGSELEILQSLNVHGIRCPMAVECHSEYLHDACEKEVEAMGMKWIGGGGKVGVNYIML